MDPKTTPLIDPKNARKARRRARDRYKKDDHIDISEEARVTQTDDDGLWVAARIFIEFGRF